MNGDQIRFTARDAKVLCKLTYQQVEYWDQQGALPGRQKKKEGWRTFTPMEMFSIMVCSEIRKNLGVSLEKLAVINTGVMEYFPSKADLLHTPAGAKALDMWLLADCAHTCRFMKKDELKEHLVEHPTPCILLRVDPLVTRLREYMAGRRKQTARQSRS